MSERTQSRPTTQTMYQILVALSAGAIFAQPILAGEFLDGGYSALAVHQANGTVIGVLLLLTLVLQVVRYRRAPSRPVKSDVIVLVALIIMVGVEAALGTARIVVAHIPLGVLIATLALVLALRAWAPRSLDGGR